jgi:regulator of sigma E protease
MALTQIFSFGLKNIPLVIAGIGGIGFVIAFHEFGHFLFGKLFGVNIPNFSVGFGPKLMSKKIGTTTFSLSAIPLGGYVEAESGTYGKNEPGTIAALAYWKKMAIIGGGILFNLIFSYFVFVGLSVTGIPGNPFFVGTGTHLVQKIEKNSAAEKAGLQAGDKIIKINEIATEKQIGLLLETLRKHPNQIVQLTVKRDEAEKIVTAHIGSKEFKGKQIGSLGVHFGFEATPPVSLSKAFCQAYTLTSSIVKNSITGFGRAFSKRSTDGLAGPLMMISLTAQTAGHSAGLFLLLLAVVSISLAVLNIIPLPILDGGQAVTYTLETLLRRPIKEKTLEIVHMTCWVLMLGLFLYLTFKDVVAMWF